MERVLSSYKDPSGYVYIENDAIFRRINPVYQGEYEHLMKSGLYSALVEAGLLIPHEEVSPGLLKPEKIPFISYPYEWCFSQLKDAALTTLAVQKTALQFGMTLKDATAYNIQFRNGRPVFIDTLSFVRYQEGDRWLPYRQYCQHFLAPLMLMAYTDMRLEQLLRIYLDGVPLDLARKLLPLKARANTSFWLHILAPGLSQQHPTRKQAVRTGKTTLLGLLNSLEKGTAGLKWKPRGNWVDYLEAQEQDYLEYKKQAVRDYLAMVKPALVWDLGANAGVFSEVCREFNAGVVSIDSDPGCIENFYLRLKESKKTGILPLVMDLTNPSASLGWANRERMSLLERSSRDTVLALALVHHLALTYCIPLSMIASFFSRICRSLIIEFVPKEDPQARKLLATRADIFPDYHQAAFEDEFKRYFNIVSSRDIPGSQRKLYLLKGDTES